ncbi:MAG: filamentous hemagglutinin N-terminal domain-containing protein, partial [Tepidisphaeraceae bacterium]
MVLSSAILAAYAEAAPHGAAVVSGTATISTSGSLTKIVAGNNSIISYSSFDIARGETVQFVQPSVASRVLNRIASVMPTQIDGTLTANGQVYLVNPSGIIFGQGSVVNAARFIAAAGSISNADFLAGNDHFTGVTGEVTSAGTIQASQIALIGQQIANSGTIVAPSGGLVTLVAGTDVYLQPAGGGIMVQVAGVVSGSSGTTSSTPAAANSGTVQAPQGQIFLGAGDLYSVAISNTGMLQASNIKVQAGKGGTSTISGTINASDTTPGAIGGTVQITGAKVNLASANITASGPAGGGIVEIGGGPHGGGDLPHADDVSLDRATVINADATSSGAGGSIVLWSSDTTDSSATLTCRGGPLGGNGGNIETSGDYVSVTRAPNESAPNGSLGTWRLDPLNVAIVAGANNGILTGSATVTNGTIEAALLTGNVIVTTNQAGSDGGTLTLSAPITGTLTAAATLTLQGNSTIDLTGGSILYPTGAPLSVEIDEFDAKLSSTVGQINIGGSLRVFGGVESFEFDTTQTAGGMTIGNGTPDTGGAALTATSIELQNAGITTTAGGITMSAHSIDISGDARITSAGAITINAPNAFNFSSNSGGDMTSTVGGIAITAGSITFNDSITVDAGTGSVTLQATTGDVSLGITIGDTLHGSTGTLSATNGNLFVAPNTTLDFQTTSVVANNSIQIPVTNTTGTLVFNCPNGGVSAEGDITAHSVAITARNITMQSVTTTTGDQTYTALNAGSISVSGNLVSRNVTVSGGNIQMDGNVNTTGAQTYTTPLTTGMSITMSGTLTGQSVTASATNLTLHDVKTGGAQTYTAPSTGDISLNSTYTTSGGAATFNGPVSLDSISNLVTVDTTNAGSAGGGDVKFTGTVVTDTAGEIDGLAVKAGTGNVTLQRPAGTEATPLASTTLAGNNINVTDVSTSGNQSYSVRPLATPGLIV